MGRRQFSILCELEDGRVGGRTLDNLLYIQETRSLAAINAGHASQGHFDSSLERSASRHPGGDGPLFSD